jgi:hypothetical protein
MPSASSTRHGPIVWSRISGIHHDSSPCTTPSFAIASSRRRPVTYVRVSGSVAATSSSIVNEPGFAGGTWPMPSRRSMRYAAISRRGSLCVCVCWGLNAAREPFAKSSRSDSDVPPWLSLRCVSGAAAIGASNRSSGASNTVFAPAGGATWSSGAGNRAIRGGVEVAAAAADS